MKTISRYIMTLALLITAVGGAWAQSSLNAVEFKVPAGWEGDVTSLTAADFPGFKDYSTLTDDEAKAIPNPDPSYNQAIILVYGFDGIETKYIVWDEEDIRVIKMSVARDAFYEETSFNRKIYYTYADPNAIEVTTNAAEEGATFTEASFEMPTSDVDVDYELVRDMGYKVAFSGVPTRARLAKDGDGKFHFADGLTFQLLDNIDAANPKDITSAEGITFMVGEVEAVDFEGNIFYQLNKETLVPLADFLADAHLGNYAICAVASTGEYDGTLSSGMIELYQGYQVVIPAGEYVTYYKDEAVRLEEKDKNDIELCTITAVEDGKAVLSNNFDAMKANTPFLLKNTTNEEKTILLIPCNEPNLAVTVANEFKGTLTAKEFTEDDMATGDFYVCNGKEFIKVRGAGTLAPNKAFLFVEGNNTPASIPFRRSIGGEGGEGTTSIDAIDNAANNDANATWYDLNGRRLQGKPSQKGIYIKNGRKVVVH